MSDWRRWRFWFSRPGAGEACQGDGTVELIARGRGLDDAGNPRLVESGIDEVVDPGNSNSCWAETLTRSFRAPARRTTTG